MLTPVRWRDKLCGGVVCRCSSPGVPTGTWSSTASLNEPRYRHTSNLLQDETVLLAGGVSGLVQGSNLAIQSIDIYDPLGETWSSLR